MQSSPLKNPATFIAQSKQESKTIEYTSSKSEFEILTDIVSRIDIDEDEIKAAETQLSEEEKTTSTESIFATYPKRLHQAAGAGHLPMIRALFNRGIDPITEYITDKNELHIPIINAVLNKQTEATLLLLQKGGKDKFAEQLFYLGWCLRDSPNLMEWLAALVEPLNPKTATLDAHETRRSMLPQFNLAKVKFPEKIKDELFFLSNVMIQKSPWNVISNQLLVQRINIIYVNSYYIDKFYTIAYIFNIKTNQHYYLLNEDDSSEYTVCADEPDCILSVTHETLRIWNLKNCTDIYCTLSESNIFKMLESNFFDIFTNGTERIHQIQFFPTGIPYQLLIQTYSRLQEKNSSCLYLIDLINVTDIGHLNLIKHPIVKRLSFFRNYHAESTCQILNANTFLIIQSDDEKKRSSIVFYKIQFNTPHEPIITELQQIQFADLKINEEDYTCSFLSPNGKYLVIVCGRYDPKESYLYTFKSFELASDISDQYSYKKLSQAEIRRECVIAEHSLSAKGFLQWRNHGDENLIYTWDIKTDQITSVPVPFRNNDDHLWSYSDKGFSIFTKSDDTNPSELITYHYEDPRLALEARSIINSFPDAILDIVAGYVSQNTSAFFNANAGTLNKLSYLKNQKDNDQNTEAALTLFYQLDKLGKPLDVCALEALKQNPNPKVTHLLTSILEPFQNIRGYDKEIRY
ncbi:MAG: hypothetical protein ACYCQI_05015 [Gammaproteobacteria bacterium]